MYYALFYAPIVTILIINIYHLMCVVEAVVYAGNDMEVGNDSYHFYKAKLVQNKRYFHYMS